MGVIYFGWLAVWVPNPDWLCRYWSYATFVRRLGEAATPGGGKCGPRPDFASNTLAFALQLRKITTFQNFSAVSDLLSEASKFQRCIKLCSKCSILLRGLGRYEL
jgi:hypothetical protein